MFVSLQAGFSKHSCSNIKRNMVGKYVNTVHDKSLRKHAYSNILKNLQPKKENFQIKKNDIFHISVQNTDCWYSLEPPRLA